MNRIWLAMVFLFVGCHHTLAGPDYDDDDVRNARISELRKQISSDVGSMRKCTVAYVTQHNNTRLNATELVEAASAACSQFASDLEIAEREHARLTSWGTPRNVLLEYQNALEQRKSAEQLARGDALQSLAEHGGEIKRN